MKRVTIEDVVKEIKNVASILEKDPQDVRFIDMKREGDIPASTISNLGGLTLIKDVFLLQDKDPSSIKDMQDLRSVNRGFRRKLADRDNLLDRIEIGVSNMPPIKNSGYRAKKPKATYEKTLTNILSDTHFGLDLDPRETMHKYGAVEESRALASIAKNLCEYKLDDRKRTSLVLNILGDMIENHLHSGGAQEELHLQVCRAIHLLVQYVEVASHHFPNVLVNFAVGNHGRDKSIHTQRATASKYNAVETSIYFAVRKAFRHAKNIKFNQPMTPWVDYKIHGHRFYATHGDTTFNVGSVGKTVSVGNILNMTNQINANQPEGEKYSVFMFGHLHQFMTMQLSNGVWIIGNGALCPPNPFAQTLDIMTSPQNQALFETTKMYPVGDIRAINAAGSENDESLDKIIQPWEGL